MEFRVEAKGANGKAIRDTYWDLSNEETASDTYFTYTFNTPGLYPVVCSVTDEDGWMAYQTVLICVAQPEKERPNAGQPRPVTAETYALWRFDSGLTDEVKGLAAELRGNATLSEDNLLWMARPSGHAVRVHGPDDGVRIRLPDRLLNDPSFQSVRVEVLVNYEKDTGWGEGPSTLLGIDCNYNTKLGLCKVKWTGKSVFGVSGDELKAKPWRAVAETQPGWMNWALGFDRTTGKSYLESAHGKVEFTYTPGPSKNENILDIGGFIGFLDEVRITTTRNL